MPTVVLTSSSGTSFNRPADWNPYNNKIEVIGVGGSGGVGSPASGTVGTTTFYLAGGGSGAAYAFATNVDVEFPVALTWGFAGSAVMPSPFGGLATSFGTYVSAGAGMNGYPNGFQLGGAGSGTGGGDVNGPGAMPAQNLATWPNGLYGGMGGAGLTTYTGDPTGNYGAGGGSAAGPSGAGADGGQAGTATGNGNGGGGTSRDSHGTTMSVSAWGSGGGYGPGRGGGGGSAAGGLMIGGNGGNYGGGGGVGNWVYQGLGNTRTPRAAGSGGQSLIVVTWTPAIPIQSLVAILA